MAKAKRVGAYYLLTAKEKTAVYDILKGGGFIQCHSRLSHEVGFKFKDKSEIPWENQVAISDNREPTPEDKYHNPLSIAYACSESGLQLPKTRIFVDGVVLDTLINTTDSKAIKTLQETEPFAVYAVHVVLSWAESEKENMPMEPPNVGEKIPKYSAGFDSEMLERIKHY